MAQITTVPNSDSAAPMNDFNTFKTSSDWESYPTPKEYFRLVKVPLPTSSRLITFDSHKNPWGEVFVSVSLSY